MRPSTPSRASPYWLPCAINPPEVRGMRNFLLGLAVAALASLTPSASADEDTMDRAAGNVRAGLEAAITRWSAVRGNDAYSLYVADEVALAAAVDAHMSNREAHPDRRRALGLQARVFALELKMTLARNETAATHWRNKLREQERVIAELDKASRK